ncbi:MAG: alpha-mannosidase [Spirochaetales bacterium]|nr:alpha-mannosidase [Spirochaetales bacterium]
MYFYKEKLDLRIQEIGSAIYQERFPIHDFLVKEGNAKDLYKENLDDTWKASHDTDQWGGYAKYQWFRFTARIPDEWKGSKVALFLETPGDIAWKVAAEYTAYVDGHLAAGLDIFHKELPLVEKARRGTKYDIAILGFSGYNQRRPTITIQLVKVSQIARDYYYNLKMAYESSIWCDNSQSPEAVKLQELVNASINMVDFRLPKSKEFYDSLEKANEFLVANVYNKMHSKVDFTVSAIGHSHLDIAWLWRLQQSKEKSAHTFATQDRLMKQFPDFKFIQSQPQVYEYTKKYNAELYRAVKKRVAEGRIIPEGGMWVEADCNLISGESMIRQFLVGKKFFRDEFGVDNKILWLPDVFGYSAAMPQILLGCGIKYFMTTKISWNQFNNLPMDTFYLQGIDGSKVLTHFMTTPIYNDDSPSKVLSFKKTYNGRLTPRVVANSWNTYHNKDINTDMLLAFGYGDGGGGPDDEMCENGERLKDMPGIPKVKWESPVLFFERLEKSVKGKNIPTWVGELYLEFHRGTYTSQAKNKRFNRKTEFLYQDVEALSSLAMLLGSYKYPASRLLEDWKVILLNQFHDIIPGSSIHEVYEDSKKQYLALAKSGVEMRDEAILQLASMVGTSKSGYIVFNPNAAFAGNLVRMNINKKFAALQDPMGNVCPVQKLSDGTTVFYAPALPSYGYQLFVPVDKPARKSSVSVSVRKLENRFFRIRLDEKGQLSEIYDKRYKRQVMPKGQKGNVLLSFEDKPMNYNAWDIDIYYPEKCYPIDDLEEITVKEEGPVMGVLHLRRRYLQSVIEQDIIIYDDIPRIDFRTTIDWKQSEIMVKAQFPTNVNSTRATYEIQLGALERNTHSNTSWDAAKFEVCAHKWADLSQNDWGVAIMNDCKYGHDIHGNVMRLTLLKSGIYPDATADQEMHYFTYSLYPHEGSWVDAGVTNAAYALNKDLPTSPVNAGEGVLPTSFSLFSMNNPNIIIETVKASEDGAGIVARLYECANTSAKGILTLGKAAKRVEEVNMIEENPVLVKEGAETLELEFRPYEIRTLKFTF